MECQKVPKPYSPSELVKHVEGLQRNVTNWDNLGQNNYCVREEDNSYKVVPICLVFLSGLEKLSKDEENARQRLETKIERAFYEAGAALRELRERRLYRSTHRTFEEYCRDRFDFTRRRINHLIAATTVVENLQVLGTICSQTEKVAKLKGLQAQSGNVLPTSESQCRPLIDLEPDEQRSCWQQAVAASNGKVPPARVVKGIVDKLRAKPPAENLDSPHEPGDLVFIKAPSGALTKQRQHNGLIAVVSKINRWNVDVYVEGKLVEYRSDDLQPLESYNANIKDVVHKANQLLARKDLDPLNRGIVRLYLKQQSFSKISLDVLQRIWEHYMEPTDSN